MLLPAQSEPCVGYRRPSSPAKRTRCVLHSSKYVRQRARTLCKKSDAAPSSVAQLWINDRVILEKSLSNYMSRSLTKGFINLMVAPAYFSSASADLFNMHGRAWQCPFLVYSAAWRKQNLLCEFRMRMLITLYILSLRFLEKKWRIILIKGNVKQIWASQLPSRGQLNYI